MMIQYYSVVYRSIYGIVQYDTVIEYRSFIIILLFFLEKEERDVKNKKNEYSNLLHPGDVALKVSTSDVEKQFISKNHT